MKQSEMLVQVAKWYYLDSLSQAEIAGRIHKSRSMVSKMLTEAKSRNLVNIRINYPVTRNHSLEQTLCSRFSLKDARVVDTLNSSDLNQTVIAKTAADCLSSYLEDNQTIGIAWSRTLRTLVEELEPRQLQNSTVVQLSGAASLEDPTRNGSEIIQQFAQKVGAEQRFFPAPLVVRHPEVAEALMSEPTVQQSIAAACSSDIAVVGIGTVDRTYNALLQSKLIGEETLESFIQSGSVGDILAHQLDRDGNLLDMDFNRRIIGMNIMDLRKIPRVIGVAAGPGKADAIRAAVAGCYVNIVITDSRTATELLEKAPVHVGCR